MRSTLISATILVLTAAVSAAPKQAPQQRVAALIGQLKDPDPDTRDTAFLTLQRLDYEDGVILTRLSADPDLTADQRAKIADAQKYRAPMDKLIETVHARRKPEFEWRGKTVLDAYENGSHTNPKWDKLVHQFVDCEVAVGETLYWSVVAARRAEAVKLGDELIASGCDDPNVTLLIAYAFQGIPERANASRDFYFVATETDPDALTPDARLTAYCRTLGYRAADVKRTTGRKPSPAAQASLKDNLTAIFDAWNKLLGTDGVPVDVLCGAAEEVLTATRTLGVPDEKMFPVVIAPLEKAAPDDDRMMVTKGDSLMRSVAAIRTAGPNPHLTPEVWTKVESLLDQSEAAYKEAYKADPTNTAACVGMIRDEQLRQKGDNAGMKKWFDRAVAVNPDLQDAWVARGTYLMPDRHGSSAERDTFFQEVMEHDKGFTDLSMVPLSIHRAIAALAPDPDQYFADPAVWKQIDSSLEMVLKRRPDLVGLRSLLARYACLGSHWKTAAAQFKLAGDKLDPKQFKSPEEFKNFRATAGEKAAGSD